MFHPKLSNQIFDDFRYLDLIKTIIHGVDLQPFEYVYHIIYDVSL